MPRPRILALILAGGRGSRMEVLTDFRAKPALPYAGVYRLIDFSLSNLRNSGISHVKLLVQYQAQTIMEELANGRPWDLDRTTGGLQVVPPQQRRGDESDEEIVPSGNAAALLDNLDVIRKFAPDVLLVLSSDHIYTFDYFTAIDQHLENNADATLVTTTVPIGEASNFGVCEVADDGRITGFAYKPDDAAGNVITTEIFVYNPTELIDTLESLADDSDEGLGDFGDELIPALIERGRVFGCPLDGYWKDMGRPEAYFSSHMDLLADTPELNLDDRAWPIFTQENQRVPAPIREGSMISDSLISPGCDIRGTVERSVLAPGVVVEEGATVRNAVMLPDTVVKTGARVQYAIVDGNVVIGGGAEVGEPLEGDAPSSDDLVLIGQHAHVHGDSRIRKGARVQGVDPLQQGS